MVERPRIRTDIEIAVAAERERCAKIADSYAEENQRMAADTIMLDPVISGQPITSEAICRSKDAMIEGCIHSSMFHAAKNIASAIRSQPDMAAEPDWKLIAVERGIELEAAKSRLEEIAQDCEAVARTDCVDRQEARTWRATAAKCRAEL